MKPKISLGSKMLLLCISVILFVQQAALAQTNRPTSCGTLPEEEACLKELADVAKRDGSRLTLKLKNGTTKVISDAKECDDPNKEAAFVTYTLAGYIGERYFIVRVFPYECPSVLLVHRRNGEELMLGNWPQVSPDKTHFVVAASSAAGECPQEYTVAIFSLASDLPRLEWRFTVPDDNEDYSIDRWDGENRVLLKGDILGKRTPTDLRLTAQGWQLRRANGELSLGERIEPSVQPGLQRSTTQPAPPQAPAAE